MGDLTANLSRHEFRCQCGNCQMEAVDFDLPRILQDTRDYFSKITGVELRIKVSSGNRCDEHNASVGGSSESKHSLSLAADWWLIMPNGERFDMRPVYKYMDEMHQGKLGLALYENVAGLTRIHTDTATIGRPWRRDYTKR